MSKRVSNKRGRSRKTPERSKVSYGWKMLKMFGIFGKDKVLSGEYLKEKAND